jgi:hypothetical protein
MKQPSSGLHETAFNHPG